MIKKQILNAIESIANAQKEIEDRFSAINSRKENSKSYGQYIAQLEKDMTRLRDSAIQFEIANGARSETVAKEYNLSASRVSQIAPRKYIYKALGALGGGAGLIGGVALGVGLLGHVIGKAVAADAITDSEEESTKQKS